MKSAMRYVESPGTFNAQRIEQALANATVKKLT